MQNKEYVVRVVLYPWPKTCGVCYSETERCDDCIANGIQFPKSHLIGYTVLEAFEACGLIETSPESDKVYDILMPRQAFVGKHTVREDNNMECWLWAQTTAQKLEDLGFNAVAAPRWKNA